MIEVSNLTPAVGEVVRFVLSDPDGDIATGSGLLISCGLSAQDSLGVWQPVLHSPSYSMTLSYTVDEDDTGKPLRAEVYHFDRSSPDHSLANRKHLTSEATAAVTADPIINAPPRFRSGLQQTIPESPAGVEVGAPVVASDRDNDTLTFAINNNPDDLFEINASTGQLSTKQELDFESVSGLLLLGVTLHDGADADDNPDDTEDVSATVAISVSDLEEEGVVTLSDADPDGEAIDDTINVADVNEAPVVSGDAAPSMRENANSAVATYRAADPERDTVAWSVNDPDFYITDGGQLHFRVPPSFEDGASYPVTVTATDDDSETPLSGSLDVAVTITDVEEPGTVAVTPPRGWEGTRFSAPWRTETAASAARVGSGSVPPTAPAGRTSLEGPPAPIRRVRKTPINTCGQRSPTRTPRAATRRLPRWLRDGSEIRRRQPTPHPNSRKPQPPGPLSRARRLAGPLAPRCGRRMPTPGTS